MATQASVSNRLHRSGAIDFNVEYALRQAQIFKDPKMNGKRIFCEAARDDALSVCEGEPLVTPKKQKGNNEIFDIAKFQEKDAINDIDLHEKARDEFFKNYNYTGIAVSKWAYGPVCRHGRLRPGPELVLELSLIAPGGLNSIYTDVDAQAGDTIVVDLPYPCLDDLKGNVAKYDLSSTHGSVHQSRNWGFAMCATKKGVPKEKQTLVVRPIPPLPAHSTTHEYAKQLRMRKRFRQRGQVIGKCVRGARKGERIDLVLGANCMGSINLSDF